VPVIRLAGGVVIVSLFRATQDGLQFAAHLRVVESGRVEFDLKDNAAKHYVADLQAHGIWSRKLRRTVHVDDGTDFLNAVVESLLTSSYWHASVDVGTPALKTRRRRVHVRELAEAN
jgi:hypothetical protein